MNEYEKSLIEELQNTTEDEVNIWDVLESAKSSASQKGKELIKLMNSIRLPKTTASPNDNVTRQFFSNDLSIDVWNDVLTGEDKKNKIPLYAYALISLQDVPDEIKLDTTAVNDMDDLVFRAVCAYYDAGITQFTGHNLYRQMTGNNRTDASPDMLLEIDKSWKRLTHIQITLDTGKVGNSYGFVEYKREETVISGRREVIEWGNQYGECKTILYSIYAEPVLLDYAKHLKQISRVSPKILDTPVKKCPEVLTIQTRLMDRIQAIAPPDDGKKKNGKKKQMSNHILYDSLFRNIEFSDKTRDSSKARLRIQIAKILDYWQKEGLIISWQNIKDGNRYYAIEIQKYPPKSV